MKDSGSKSSAAVPSVAARWKAMKTNAKKKAQSDRQSLIDAQNRNWDMLGEEHARNNPVEYSKFKTAKEYRNLGKEIAASNARTPQGIQDAKNWKAMAANAKSTSAANVAMLKAAAKKNKTKKAVRAYKDGGM